MVKYQQTDLDRVFQALSDPTRRAILGRLLARNDRAVGELAAPFSMSGPAITKHLKVLEAAGLVKRSREGRVIRCRLRPEPMKDAMQWLERYEVFWNQRLDALEAYLETKSKGEPWPTPKLNPQPSPKIPASPLSGDSRRRSRPSIKPGATRKN